MDILSNFVSRNKLYGTGKKLIFDFDGTLVDTAPLIIRTMQATMRVMKLPIRDNNQCRAVIGLRLEEIPDILWPEHPGIGEVLIIPYGYRRNQYTNPRSQRDMSNDQ